MKNNRIIKTIHDALRDQNRPFTGRNYLMLTIVFEVTLLFALIGDIITHEYYMEIVLLALSVLAVPSLMYVCLIFNKLRFAIRFTVICLVFFALPALYFFGGGKNGGGITWIVFSFMYAGLVLVGTFRTVMFVLIVVMSLGCYMTEYYYPEFAVEHARSTLFVNSFISVVLVGFICFVMTWIQNRLLQEENKRAREAAEKAEELSRAQNRFFSSMSHEIRTPINSILGLNELTLRDQSTSDEIARNASGIQGSGKMLLSLINDILDFSKMEAGSMDIVPVEYKVSDLLSEIVNMIWIRANDKGLIFNVTVDPKVPAVLFGDEVRIKQIIVNLLNNAVKYTAEGSVELHVESNDKDEHTVELSISISDTGMGIKKESLPYLFDAFKRVDEEKNRYIEGTGLGLSIVKQLVELMGGTITVNSVYGEGSTFTVVLSQGISTPDYVGDLNIHNQSFSRRNAYESSFRAPEARILIVDDNEMNLEVESKLLADTELVIDKALSGKEALELDLNHRYDVILMDHLMPEMDGIECLEKLRHQAGGMNRTTPVVVLTANAGSDNRELYNRSGFDGYLVKPVSGEALEDALMKYISADKLILNQNKMMNLSEEINASAGYAGKMPVIISSTSMCDLPVYLIKKLHIPILPFKIRTEEGVFKDGVQLGADELIRYLESGKSVESMPPDEAEYTEFFASTLKQAHHLIHIAITTSMSNDYKVASEAAKSFDNVTVINSESVSSATGILVLIAYKLAQMYNNVDDIVSELESIKHRLKCSFIIDTTEYMARRALISNRISRLANGLSLHPAVKIQDDVSGIGGVWFGDKKRSYRKYIAKAFPVDVIPDPEVVFITYADVPVSTLMWIKEEISKIAYFEHVIFRQASAAISANCGPGAFGILYFVKSNKTYNLSSLLEHEELYADTSEDLEEIPYEEGYDEEAEGAEVGEEYDAVEKEAAEMDPERGESFEASKWYENIEGIDSQIAIKNSGSEDAFKTVLKIFYDSIDKNAAELDGLYEISDWKNYTIKVHALKSSAKLIGAMDTAEKAQLLENAGKEENAEYITENHAGFMEKYHSYKNILGGLFGTEETEETEKPVADEELMNTIYEELYDAADSMDCDAIEDSLKKLEGYEVPEGEKDKFKAILEKVREYDYDGIMELLK